MFQNLQNCYAIQRKTICIICQDITGHITVASHSELIAEKHVRRLLAFFIQCTWRRITKPTLV